MNTRIYVNNFIAVTTADLSSVGTTLTISNSTNLPTLANGDYYYLTLSTGITYEIVKVTARTGLILTIVRAQEGTTNIAWSAGAAIDMRYTAASIVDSNGNSFANNHVSGYTTNATAAGTTVLTATSSKNQYFTGSTTETVTLPVVTTLSLGHEFTVVNASSGVVTVQSSGANTVQALAAGTTAVFTCILITGTSAASWSVLYVNTALSSSIAAFLATPSSANLAAALTDETGTGAAVFATSPALVSPTSNSFIDGYSTTATAAGTTTLTVSSTKYQVFTGSTTQTCVLPVVSTLVLGTVYIITNISSGVVTVQSSGANTIQAMQANTTLIVQSNATSGTGASVWNVVAYYAAASGMTGSGSVVRATSPTFVTPTLGAALATSINFGDESLSKYDEGTWTPVFTFDTPGDLSVSYAIQTGKYVRVGNLVHLFCYINFTPTHTTAAGAVRITGKPFAQVSGTFFSGSCGIKSAFTFPAGASEIAPTLYSANSYVSLFGRGTGITTTDFTTTNFPTAVANYITFTIVYSMV